MFKFTYFTSIFFVLTLLINSLNLSVFSLPNNLNKTSPPITKEKDWSIWQPWVDFPFDDIQVGLSNMDLGGMMDFEYSCFGSVSDENNTLKQETYWYRIADKVERIGQDNYVTIEVGCWLNNEFKSTTTLTGIKN